MQLSTDKACASAEAIAEVLRNRIAGGTLPPGSRLPVRQDMCREFNAALATMQRAIDALVEEGFICCIPGKGTFVHEHPPSKADLALVFGSAISARSLFCEALRTVAAGLARRHGYRVCPFELHGEQRAQATQQLVDLATGHRLAGIILISPTADILASLPRQGGIATVLIGREGRNHPEFPRVEVDQDGFAAAAMAHLRSHGRRRIAHLLADGILGHRDDTADWLQAFACEDSPFLVQFVAEGRRWRGAEHIAHLLMRLPPAERPNGLIVHDDNLVHWAGLGLRASGVAIPDELEVVVHANHPCPPACPVPHSRFGFDAQAVLEAAISLLAVPRDPARSAIVIAAGPLP